MRKLDKEKSEKVVGIQENTAQNRAIRQGVAAELCLLKGRRNFTTVVDWDVSRETVLSQGEHYHKKLKGRLKTIGDLKML